MDGIKAYHDDEKRPNWYLKNEALWTKMNCSIEK